MRLQGRQELLICHLGRWAASFPWVFATNNILICYLPSQSLCRGYSSTMA